MPRVNVPVTTITRTGVAPATPVTGDATNNHTVNNNGRVVLLAKNTNAVSTARVVTIHVEEEVDGQAVSSRTYSLAAGASEYIGPFPVNEYGHDLLVDVAHAELVLSAYTF